MWKNAIGCETDKVKRQNDYVEDECEQDFVRTKEKKKVQVSDAHRVLTQPEVWPAYPCEYADPYELAYG